MRRPSRFLFALAGALYLTALARDGVHRWVDATVLPPVLAETSVEMRDRNGDLLRAFPVEDGIWRLQPGAVDPNFTAMLVRYEDKRFWTHAGVDPVAMLRAVGQSLWNGRTVSGGSTLTMQVARLIEDGSTGRWSGKIRQIRVALALEQQLSKRQILTLYLTHAPYGGNLEGIRAGTRAWFGKDATRLTAAQAALLIALPQSPEARRPDRQPETARVARDRVLRRLARYGTLTAAETSAAMAEIIPDHMRPFPRLAPHLTDRMKRLTQATGAVDLTLNARLQARLEGLVAQAATRAGPRVSGALIVADHRSGEVLASVGSAGYQDARQGFVDMTQALRSPGSTLKPLVYGLAFDQGLAHPETLISDSPVMFGRYAPRNFDGAFRGDVRVRDALQLSLNIPVVRLTNALGPARVMTALRLAGSEPRLSGGTPGLAISLGGVGLSLRDLVQIYATLAEIACTSDPGTLSLKSTLGYWSPTIPSDNDDPLSFAGSMRAMTPVLLPNATASITASMVTVDTPLRSSCSFVSSTDRRAPASRAHRLPLKPATGGRRRESEAVGVLQRHAQRRRRSVAQCRNFLTRWRVIQVVADNQPAIAERGWERAA